MYIKPTELILEMLLDTVEATDQNLKAIGL